VKRACPATVLLIGAVGIVLLVPSALAAPAAAAPVSTKDDARAVALLHRASIALDEVSYRGSRILSAWGSAGSTTALMDVEHVPGQGTLVRLRGGSAADETAAFLAAAEGDSRRQPGLGVDSLRLLTESYDVWTGRSGRVAGRSAEVVEIGHHPHTLVARIWVDERTGLPLRKEMFDVQGRLARESAFIDLEIEHDGFIAHLPPTPPDETPERHPLGPAPGVASTEWSCPQQVGSLRLVGVERTRTESGTSTARHMSYSDGLSRVSVFEQRGSLEEQELRGFTPRRVGGATVQVREGMPSSVVWEDDGAVYTAVSDAPMDTIERVVRAYPHSSAERGFWGRVASGFGRLSAWVTPLV
jgi:negative regulator of sigma E activity